ncbi:TMF family protein [Anaerotignum propionicum]|uniref:ABC transmembrane type-1 domain-containing protein n=1 Tax=Anaerotignum propionicum DSM 1682 TaxID=991789 RepID=A0A0X1U7L7_ANAPI|nr:TMF family protein [Anaerotignum propionicum]AMJ40922.1 hypothetical protein CPRO_13290 [Anaerotignum propionicum DSM 1682]SHE58935.1 hypothetical protein SAMN02745151_01142 [[Clostridium] propionicum DSM 1682] [Anaerotignum propionicum DSM 1682]
MVDRLISAYRAQIYDWTWAEWRSLFKNDTALVLCLILFIVAPVFLICLYYITQSNVILILIIFAEGITVYRMDRFTVKQYRKFLSKKEDRLSKTILYLKTTMETQDLRNEVQIDELVKRLSERIEKRDTLKNFTYSVVNFGKAIILPMITFIAGVYSNDLGNLRWEIICSYSIMVVLILGFIRISWGGVSMIVRTLLCRDYDAALALREDLLDIKFLYFS